MVGRDLLNCQGSRYKKSTEQIYFDALPNQTKTLNCLFTSLYTLEHHPAIKSICQLKYVFFLWIPFSYHGRLHSINIYIAVNYMYRHL